MQKDMLETKGALEHTVKHHKESVKKTRAIENQISVCICQSTSHTSPMNTVNFRTVSRFLVIYVYF